MNIHLYGGPFDGEWREIDNPPKEIMVEKQEMPVERLTLGVTCGVTTTAFYELKEVPCQCGKNKLIYVFCAGKVVDPWRK